MEDNITVDTVNVTCIPNHNGIEAGIVANFTSVGHLAVHSYLPLKSGDFPSKFAPCKGIVHLLRPDSILFDDPEVRKMVNESNGVFLSIQKLASEKTSSTEKYFGLVKLSRQYRSVIRACVAELQGVAVCEDTDESRRESCQRNNVIFYSIELVWHLCEILVLNSGSGNMLLPQLLEWVRFHFPKSSQQMQQVLQQPPGVPAERHPEFWTALFGLVLQGRSSEARSLLGRHSAAQTSPAVGDMRQLLNAMPKIEAQGGTSAVVDFTLQWKSWQKEVSSKLEAGAFSSIPHLQQLAELLAADNKALTLIHSHCDTWYQFLISYLQYWEPTVQAFQLGNQAKKCIALFEGTSERDLKTLDRILLALFDTDLLEAIKDLQQISESGWASAHLTDLLFHSGRLSILDSHDLSVAEKLREDLLLQYGCLLMSHRSLWQAGLSYLDYCPNLGKGYISLILPKLYLGSDRRALCVIQEAEARGLHEIVVSICKVLGMRALHKDRLGSALTWALRADDAALASHVADRILRGYALHGKFTIIDLLDNLGSSMLTSDRLVFLSKYREFHLIYQDLRFKDAASLLVELVTSGLSPTYFIPVLLMDAVPLLETQQPVFTSEDTHKLMACLEEMKIVDNGDHTKDTLEAAESLKDKESLIRLALARNLARSSLDEMCH